MDKIHTLKLPLHCLSAYEKRTLDKKLYAHGRLYNAVLKECLRRINNYHQECEKLGLDNKDWKKKNKLKRKYELSKFDIIQVAQQIKRNSNNSLLDGLTVNQTASRVWLHCQDYLNKRKNKPSLKNPANLNTVTGSGNRQNLRLLFLKETYGTSKQSGKWLSKDLTSISQPEDLKKVILSWSGRETAKRKHSHLRVNWLKLSQVRRDFIVQLLQNDKLAQTGIKRELIRGEWKYYILLTFNSPPYRPKLEKKPEGTLAIDTGPAQSKGVDNKDNKVHLKISQQDKEKFKGVEGKIKKKQRKLERSLRINNPEAYQNNGVLKKGGKISNWSKNTTRLKNDLHELHRKRRVKQKDNTLKLAKHITSKYQTVIMEKVSYKTWFTRYSKSMKLFTPGLFQKLLQEELERRDGELKLLPLQYAFSQTCLCGNKKKKALSQRKHSCQTINCPTQNNTYDRDEFSALLMLTSVENNLDLKTYQSPDWYGCLPLKARTTIETRLNNISLNAPDYSLTTSLAPSEKNKQAGVNKNSNTSSQFIQQSNLHAR